jgi:hypothetical protein
MKNSSRGKGVIEETFGGDIKAPAVKKGTVTTFGHTINEGQAIPSRGCSPNSKTGYPVTEK